jgi:hypothetical protein
MGYLSAGLILSGHTTSDPSCDNSRSCRLKRLFVGCGEVSYISAALDTTFAHLVMLLELMAHSLPSKVEERSE